MKSLNHSSDIIKKLCKAILARNEHETINILKSHPNIDVHDYCHEMDNILTLAIRSQNLAIAKEILKYPTTNLNGRLDKFGTNILMFIIRCGTPEMLDEILKYEITDQLINTSDISGDTALTLAIRHNNITMVEMLLAHPKINVNQEDKLMHETPFLLAVKSSNLVVIQALKLHPQLNISVKKLDYTALDLFKLKLSFPDRETTEEDTAILKLLGEMYNPIS